MSAKHTPGPWTVTKGRKGHGEEWGGYWQIDAEYDAVACNQFCYAGARNAEVSEANARLIAAAPELAEALQAIDGGAPAKEPPAGPTVGFPPSNDPEADDGSDLLREAFDEGLRRGMWEAAKAARAALAKAGVQ